jgi:hypothetical protein
MTRNRQPAVKSVQISEEEARTGPEAKEWSKAREIEREQLRKLGVYTIIQEIPPGARTVDTKWVYKIKRRADETIEKYKARKVGRGFSQKYGIDYDETHAQMARMETWRILMTIALSLGLSIHQWDVVGAYLTADLKHDIYIEDKDEKGNTQYWKLHKALYGLKQSAYEWGKKLKKILREIGLRPTVKDEGCFTSGKIIIAVHVDDICRIGEKGDLAEFGQQLQQFVDIEDKGFPTKILGM